MKKIQKLENLKTLKLVNTDLKLIFTSIFNIPVELLKLDSCIISGTRYIINFTKSFPNVKFLDIKPFITNRTHFIFEEMFENMPRLENVKFCYSDAWTTPSLKIRSSSVTNLNLKSLTVNFPTIYKWAFFKNFPNLRNLDIFIDNSERASMKAEIQKMLSELKHLERICISFLSNYQIDFDILKLISFNPNLKIIQFMNVLIDTFTIDRNRKEYKKLFDIFHISGGFEMVGSSILLASNEEILMKNKVNFEKVIKFFFFENYKSYCIDFMKLYNKGMNYNNVGEVVILDEF